MLMENLSEYGLTEQESKIYTDLLAYDELSASQLSKNTKINRSVVYSHIESLINKGLVSYFIRNNVKYFKAANPENILAYLKEKEAKLIAFLPKLKQIKKSKTEEISVELYRGVEGAITILKDIVKAKKEVFVIGYAGQPEEILPIYLKQYIRQINENKIKEKILAIKGAEVFTGEHTEVRYLPKEFEIPTSTTVYGNKVVIVVYAKPYFSVLINSKDIAESYKRFFSLLWQTAKK
jgi:sugar-specific transcriptional regulator TrmB